MCFYAHFIRRSLHFFGIFSVRFFLSYIFFFSQTRSFNQSAILADFRPWVLIKYFNTQENLRKTSVISQVSVWLCLPFIRNSLHFFDKSLSFLFLIFCFILFLLYYICFSRQDYLNSQPLLLLVELGLKWNTSNSGVEVVLGWAPCLLQWGIGEELERKEREQQWLALLIYILLLCSLWQLQDRSANSTTSQPAFQVVSLNIPAVRREANPQFLVIAPVTTWF